MTKEVAAQVRNSSAQLIWSTPDILSKDHMLKQKLLYLHCAFANKILSEDMLSLFKGN